LRRGRNHRRGGCTSWHGLGLRGGRSLVLLLGMLLVLLLLSMLRLGMLRLGMLMLGM
jgi:hypothetical protein